MYFLVFYFAVFISSICYANSRELIISKIRNDRTLSLQQIAAFSNSQIRKTGIDVLASVPVKEVKEEYRKWIANEPVTACQTYEFIMHAQNPKPTETIFKKAIWNSKKYISYSEWPPYTIDVANKKLIYAYYMDNLKDIRDNPPQWWKQVLNAVPDLNGEVPFLIIESSASGLEFSANIKYYERAKQQDTRGTKEELMRMPFSKIHFYKDLNQRVQVQESCM
jgi:hypothetical protein